MKGEKVIVKVVGCSDDMPKMPPEMLEFLKKKLAESNGCAVEDIELEFVSTAEAEAIEMMAKSGSANVTVYDGEIDENGKMKFKPKGERKKNKSRKTPNERVMKLRDKAFENFAGPDGVKTLIEAGWDSERGCQLASLLYVGHESLHMLVDLNHQIKVHDYLPAYDLAMALLKFMERAAPEITEGAKALGKDAEDIDIGNIRAELTRTYNNAIERLSKKAEG